VTEEAIKRVLDELHRLHGEQLARAEERVRVELDRALRLLPDVADLWGVSQAAPTVYALSGDVLFLMTAELNQRRVRITSSRLDFETIVVDLEWGTSSSDVDSNGVTRETRWTFRYRGQRDSDLEPWQRITGSVWEPVGADGAKLDRCERFARELARLAGWSIDPAPSR
jgi:hypothetical protein